MAPPFEGSDKILEKDVLKPKERDFVKTEKEFSSRAREAISRKLGSLVAIGDQIVFTVPVKRTLFITNAWMTYNNTGANGAVFRTRFFRNNVRPGDGEILVCTFKASQAGTSALSLSFNQPLRVEEGASIILNNGNASCGVDVGFNGWIEDKTIS